MKQAFVIMQIGNTEIDKIYKKAIIPATLYNNLEAKRVDKHNEGELLKNKIVDLIQHSEIIIADVTNERPNCYLEIGYTMGLGKFNNLILTVREDHFPESENYNKNGPKVHFDIAGYDILRWSPSNLDLFAEKLKNVIKNRLNNIAKNDKEEIETLDQEWVISHRRKAKIALSQFESKFKGSMEIKFSIFPPKINKTVKELDAASRVSEIKTFGWPIGIYLDGGDSRPYPMERDIVAINKEYTFDYWALNRNGDFYSLICLYEDIKSKFNHIYYDIQIKRITESLLYCQRLYDNLGVNADNIIFFSIRYSGMNGRALVSEMASNFAIFRSFESHENEINISIRFALSQIKTDITKLVKEIIDEFFTYFSYFELPDEKRNDIVNRFVDGYL